MESPMCITWSFAARTLGSSTDTLRRWRERGVDDWTADVIATRLGVNPARIWGADEWAATGLRPVDELFIYGTDTAEPGWRQAAMWGAA